MHVIKSCWRINTFTFKEDEDAAWWSRTSGSEVRSIYSLPKRNITYERHVFNTGMQAVDETIDSYMSPNSDCKQSIVGLHLLSLTNCSWSKGWYSVCGGRYMGMVVVLQLRGAGWWMPNSYLVAFLVDEGRTLETLEFTIRIGSNILTVSMFRFLSGLIDISVLPETISVDSKFLFVFVRNRYTEFVYITNGNCKAEYSIREIRNSYTVITGCSFPALSFRITLHETGDLLTWSALQGLCRAMEKSSEQYKLPKTLLKKAPQDGKHPYIST